ncbi:MAG: lytic murein transglycosylase B [Gammaproteobacteria bacterium RIFOXYB2_FULL_38_6]|nr:MAG: lytic murein transglycosylase B [Gammaproteobacteria bacterium RIFOXYB2_FULL_38_6]
MKTFFLHSKLLLVLLASFIFVQTASAQVLLSTEQTKKNFMDEMKTKYHFEKKQIENWLSQAHCEKKILEQVSAPYEKSNWDVYRSHFVNEARIKDGVVFWQAHAATLALAEKTYGVPAYIIIGILGVETDYGKTPLPYRAIDALDTLAFYYPPRSEFFKNELEQYFLLTKEQHLSPLILRSSYAGALGVPQFMPSSYRDYAVHARQYQHADLENHIDDAILSIANYLNEKGNWWAFHPTATRAILKPNPKNKNADALKKLVSTDPTPQHSLAYYEQYGIYPADKISPKREVSLIALSSSGSTEYWFVFHNFNAIMRYNNNIGYAMVVYQLGQAVQNAGLLHDVKKHTTARTSRTRSNSTSARRS